MSSPTMTPGRHEPSLTDRYVYAVTRRLPDDQRADVAAELRGSIADRAEALREDRPDLEGPHIERATLEELGDPDELAAGYAGRPLHLIGPELFSTYRRILVSVTSIVVPIVAIVAALARAADDGSVGAVIGATVVAALTTTVHIGFWTTLVFAVLERTAGSDPRAALGVGWSPDRLPALPQRRGSLGDLVAGLAWLVVLGAAIVWQEVRPPIDTGDGQAAVLDPDLWSFWLPLVLVLLVAEMAFEVVKYRVGWTPGLATVNVVLGGIFAAPIVYLAGSDQLFNPAAVAAVQEHWSGFDVDTANAVVVVSAVAIWAWDSVDGWRKALAERRVETSDELSREV